MKKAMWKFGWKALLRNFPRLLLALIVASVSFGIAGMCVFCDTYDTAALLRESYFQESVRSGGPNKYTKLYYGPTNPVMADTGFHFKVSQDGAAEIARELKKIGAGYGVFFRSQIYEMGGNTFTINGYTARSWGGETMFFGPYCPWQNFGEGYTDSLFAEENGELVFAPYISPDFEFLDLYDSRGSLAEAQAIRYRKAATALFSNVSYFSGEEAVGELGYTLYGKFPVEADEIAIPQWLYDSFRLYGYRDIHTGQVTKVSSEEDVIGKTLRFNGDWLRSEAAGFGWNIVNPDYVPPEPIEARIVGVLGCDYRKEPKLARLYEDAKEYAEHLGMAPEEFGIGFAIFFFDGNDPALSIAVSQKLFENLHRPTENFAWGDDSYCSYVFTPRFGEHSEEVFSLVTKWKSDLRLQNFRSQQNAISYFEDNTQFHEKINAMQDVLISVFREDVMPYFSYAPYLLAFSAVFLAYFAASTVLSRRKSMGVMQSLGAGKARLFAGFLLPMLLFVVLVVAAAFGVEGILLSVVNGKLDAAAALEAVKSGYTFLAGGFEFPFYMTAGSVLLTIFGPLAVMFLSLCVLFVVFSRFSVVENLDRGKRGGRGRKARRRGEKPSKRFDNHSEGERPCD